MEAYASKAWAEIIGKAAASPLGIIALVVLVAGFVVLALVKRRDKPGFRLFAIVILLLFCGGLVATAVYTVRPTSLSAAAVKGVESEGPSQQPPTQTTEGPPAQPSPPPSQTPSTAQAPVRVDCGTAWTGWVNIGGGVGDPCPTGCVRGAEIGQSFRAVGLPPHPQVKHKFQCWRK